MAEQTETIAHPPNVERAAEADAKTIGQPGAAAAAESAGLPQFQFQHWPGQIAYLLILFAILYILMARVFTPRIRRVFEERRTTIDGALATARSVQAEAANQAEEARWALAGARVKAQKTAVEAKARSAAESVKRQAGLEAELHAKLAEAEVRIRTSRDQALGQVRGIASDAAGDIIAKLTGTKPSDEAVGAALAELKR